MEYSYCQGPPALVAAIQRIDPQLDLRFHLKTTTWHVVRFPRGRDQRCTRVWACRHDPARGLRAGLGYWICTALRRGDLRGAARHRIAEIDRHNAQVERRRASQMDDYARDYALAVRKALIRLHDEGPRAHHREVR